MAANTNFDFGFSLVSEDELKSLEKELATKNETLAVTADEYKAKFDTLYSMTMLLLKNLSSDPQKAYIFWPNRIQKINEFISKIEQLKK